ncbi:unnamed protein product [Pleuronectes platessa]|uniref:NTF2 domain-containing protein n=1 Tax=Pleuronectes platessa TaxID=8262 RepID=A0A9N7TNV4_PLEPL|nr:unnamed protein product [Pleuronectes platessa]
MVYTTDLRTWCTEELRCDCALSCSWFPGRRESRSTLLPSTPAPPDSSVENVEQQPSRVHKAQSPSSQPQQEEKLLFPVSFSLTQGGRPRRVAGLKPVTEQHVVEKLRSRSVKSRVSESNTFYFLIIDSSTFPVEQRNGDGEAKCPAGRREFVRQYYTLLNQAPDYLHSSSPLLLQEIHKRVMALSFRDCHTKIRHVDAHATLNEGVVVQVMGELSNNMQPMRKFMQTFVLAPEGTVPNKFYVHNDVFRYQDEVFGDSDSEPPEESEDEVEELEERIPSPDVAAEESTTFYDQTPWYDPLSEPTGSPPSLGDERKCKGSESEPAKREVEKEAAEPRESPALCRAFSKMGS